MTTVSAATPAAVSVAVAAVPAPPLRSSPTACGGSTTMNGARNAGSVYFQVSSGLVFPVDGR